MNLVIRLLSRIFRKNLASCPRCLGKGNVVQDDIVRLKMELFWAPGKCAYCNGYGSVPRDRIVRVKADLEYLMENLDASERRKIINGDASAIERAMTYKESVLDLVKDIEHLYYIENMEPEEITMSLLLRLGESDSSPDAKQDLLNYVEKVIESRHRRVDN